MGHYKRLMHVLTAIYTIGQNVVMPCAAVLLAGPDWTPQISYEAVTSLLRTPVI